jgi:hypothetical protein
MPHSGKDASAKQQRQRAKRERAALLMLRKSVEQQVRFAYAKVPKEAAALSQARLDMRASLVSRGYLTVEELESLAKKEAITTAVRRVAEQMRRDPKLSVGTPAYTDSTSQSACSTSLSSCGSTSPDTERTSRPGPSS